MKEHTSNFETEIKTYGRQQAVQVIYEQDGEEVVLDNENIFSATPNFKANLLKSAMKSIILDCSVEIPVGTRLQFKYGILVGNAYEYLNFGYYIVNKVEKKEDARSYEMTCYDKMMLSMVDYIDLGIEYPITIRNYIAAICNHLEIDFGSNEDQFVNYDKEIEGELYLDENGDSLDYTFRDVLDELSQATASVICIDENDQLVVRYPQRNGDYETIEGTALYIENADDGKIDLELKGNTTQNGTPTPSSPVIVKNVTGEQVVRVCGKNLFDNILTSRTINGLTIQVAEDKTITINGTISATTTLDLTDAFTLPSGTYIFSTSKSGTINNSCYLIAINTSTNAEIFSLNLYIASQKTLTLNEDTEVKFRLYSSTDRTFTNLKISPMLEKGITASTYEKYQGKDYEINLGANILDIQSSWVNSKNSTQNGLRYVLNADDTISISGTSTGYSGTYARNYNSTDVFVTLKANHTYRVLAEVSNKTSSIKSRVYFGTTSANIGGFSLTSIGGNGTYYKDYTPTQDVGLTQYSIIGAESAGETSLTMKVAIYDITTNSINKYLPYFTPIELNKIGNYQDYIRKGTGKNLADIENVYLARTLGESGALISGMNNRTTLFQNLIKPNTQYSLSVASNYQIGNIFYYKEDGTYLTTLGSSWGNNKVITTPSGAYYISFATRLSTDATMVESDLTNLHIQIEEKSTATYYEPYGYSGKWYIEKQTKKIVITTSSQVTIASKQQTGTANAWRLLEDTTLPTGIGQEGLASHWATNLKGSMYGGVNQVGWNMEARQINVRLSNSSFADLQSVKDFVTAQANNGTPLTFIVPLETPNQSLFSYSLIDNEELIEQLDRIHLEQGLNNVMISSSNLPSSLKMTYVSNLVGIDEDYLKNINVNFGEKYGPINSLVIARAADSDFIYKEDEQSVAEDGLCEIKISDNQILNDDNRVQFIDGMFNQLRGTEFYLNDFSSNGIAFLDLLDYYKIKVFDNTYKCLMLNDELDITQGLQEQIFTDRPEESETEYKSLSKEGKDIRKTMILVDKVNGRITTEIADVKGNYSSLSGTVEGLTSRVENTETAINGDDEDPNNPGLIKQVTKINSTMLTQDSSAFTAVVEQAQTASDGVKAYDEDDNLQTIRKQIKFDIDGLTISANGTTSDDMKLHLTNAAIEFLYQNHAVLTINGSTIEFSNASFKKLDLGNYVWQAEDDGSLSLIWEGGN